VLHVMVAAKWLARLGRQRTAERAAGAAPYFVHESAYVDNGVRIGAGTQIWHFSHVLKGATIGRDCVIGQNVMIGAGVTVGNRCKIQNNVSIYEGVTLEDGVFCGPSCVFTNVNNPRAEIERKSEFRPTTVGRGATIGANATTVCGHRLGPYCFVAAGAVVTRDVPPHALVVGNPARQVCWVSHAGERLGGELVCPRTGSRYEVDADGLLIEIADAQKIA
jgi:UDP-2-acetamido-3-amino-2,3-dideoxy-glucuronate N-acetyltransferase